jgi:hypothetical protein
VTHPADTAIRDMLKAVLRDAEDTLDTTAITARLPGQTRTLTDPTGALCRGDHHALKRHPRFRLRQCLGTDGHIVSAHLTATEVRGHLLALVRAGYVVRPPGRPGDHPSVERWSWVAPIGVADRNTEAMENAVFADIAALYDRPEAS